MEKHIEVIGIDHGWSNMKTATQIFTTGVKEITTEPVFYDDVVELDGKYYKVGGKRLEVRDTKVENDNFYLLTLGDEIAAVYGFPIQEENRETGGMTVMEAVDVEKEMLEEVELLGRTGYFTELRVDKETVPEGMHCYELRHGDDDGFPASVEESVRVNYFGAVLFTETLELGEEKALQIGYEDFAFTGEQMYLAQAQEKQPDRQQEEQRDTDGHVPLNTGRELLKFMEENGISFPMDEKEADLVCGYMDGHGYVVGHKDGQGTAKGGTGGTEPYRTPIKRSNYKWND